MVQLTTLQASASNDDILEVIHKDGAVILADLLDDAGIERALEETMPYIDATRMGADQFTGFKTTRTGANKRTTSTKHWRRRCIKV